MQERSHSAGSRAAAPLDPSGFVALVTNVREIGDLEPFDVPGLVTLLEEHGQPLRLSYVREGDAIALYARRALPTGAGDDAVCCATLAAPEWLLDPDVPGPEELAVEVRRDLVDLVCSSFAVLEARMAEHAPTHHDTRLVDSADAAAPTLAIVSGRPGH